MSQKNRLLKKKGMAYVNKETLLDLALQLGVVPLDADIDDLVADDLQTLIEKKLEETIPLRQILHELPTTGIVRNSGGFWYLELGTKWQAAQHRITKAVSTEYADKKLLQSLEKKFRKGPLAQTNGKFKLYSAASVFPGFHVTMDPTPALLNKKVTFRLRRMGNFSEESIRWSGSYSDATKNVSNLYWVTVSVELTGIECPHGCHISLAAYGWINKK
jgi:hypothetical protein